MVLRTTGEARHVLAHDRLLLDNADDWLANEIVHYLKRTLKRLDVTSRSLIALIEPGSCFAARSWRSRWPPTARTSSTASSRRSTRTPTPPRSPSTR